MIVLWRDYDDEDNESELFNKKVNYGKEWF